MEVSQHLPRQTRLCFGASFGCYCSPLRAVCHCRKLQQDVFPKVESMLDIWRHQPNPKWATQKLGLGTHGALHLYISLALQFGTRQASMGTLATPEPKRGMRPKTSRQCGNSHGRIWGTKEWNLKSGKQNWASTQGLLGFVSHSWHFVAPWLVFYIAILPCIIMYHQYSKRFTHQTIQNLTMHVKARIPTTLPGQWIQHKPLEGRGVLCGYGLGGVGGVGWGGVGMLTFCYLAHLVYATQLCFFCPWTHGVCYANDGVGGVGWGCWRSVTLHAWCTLRNYVSFARGHMAYAMPVMGWGGWGCWRSVTLHTWVRYATVFLLPVDTWRALRQWWVGWGGDVKFLHIERKITSVVHSHPPSHYIRKHASGWRHVMFTTRRTQNKT